MAGKVFWDGFGDAVQQVGSLVTGNPTSAAVKENMGYIKGPDLANYQVRGAEQYQNDMRGMGNRADDFGRNAGYANVDYQNQVNAQNAAFQANPGAGVPQQQQAFDAITQMAQGAGPSLARANQGAGLNQMNAALHSQAMSHAGNTGLGNTQRNLLNAQTAAANNVMQQASQSSVAEQMGALQQMGGQAAAIRSAGLGQRGQDLQAMQGAQSANLQSQALANQTGQNAQQLQQGAYNNAFAGELARARSSQAYDDAMRQTGIAQANIGLQGTKSGAAATKGAVDLFGNVLEGIGTMAKSDEEMKTDIDTGAKAKKDIWGMLKSITQGGQSASGGAPTAKPPMPEAPMGALDSGILSGGGYSAPLMQPNTSKDLVNDVVGGIGQLAHIPGAASLAGGAAGGAGVGAGLAAGGAAGGGAGLAGLLAGLSDESAKTGKQADNAGLHKFLGKLEPSSFRYKNPDSPGASEGRTHGVMAQDMERSKVGKELVSDTPHGKMFSLPKAVSTSLASLAFLNERLDKLEKRV